MSKWETGAQRGECSGGGGGSAYTSKKLAKPMGFSKADAIELTLVALAAAGLDADLSQPDQARQHALLDRDILDALGGD